MTNEEFERAIDFLLKSQARFDALMQQSAERQVKTDEQLAQTNEQLGQLTERIEALAGRVDALAGHIDAFAETQANIMRVMKQSLETEDRVRESLRATDVAQSRFSASLGEALRASDESLRAAMGKLAERQTRTEEALARLAEHTAGTDRRLEILVKIVEEGRGSQ